MNHRPASVRFFAAVATLALLVACGGGGGGNPNPVGPPATPAVTPGTTPTPMASPTNAPVPDANFQCATTAAAAVGFRRGAASSGRGVVRVLGNRGGRPLTSNTLLVEYDLSTLNTMRPRIAAQMSAHGLTAAREMTFPVVGRSIQYVHVAPAQLQSTTAMLRTLPGVRSVTQARRARTLTVNAPFFTNDPYFTGFATTVPPSPGAALPSPTASSPPYYESANVPGQWNLHVVQLEHAFAYSQPNNGSGVSNPMALGNPAVKIAIIDTGQDTTHPELGNGKIVAQGCFITDPNPNGKQSTSAFTNDPDGHGTDVTGIAAAATNNNLGFAGMGGNVSIVGYRVFPTPDNTCTGNNPDASCGADTADIAAAILDAVNNKHVNVISMSLGSCCGADATDEMNAVETAIAQHVIVVAAAGNDNGGNTPGYTPGGSVTNSIEAPGNDPGVIAAGASALNDGQPVGAAAPGPNPEYIASYSDFASTNTLHDPTSWGIVAPGGDASSNMDADDLHWILDLWTTTPFDTTTDAGLCTGDYPLETGTPDCRILINGTSMSTPHIAGAAALILSVNMAYQDPVKMKQLLCSTADDLHEAHQGCGRVNIYRAMAVALGDTNLP